MLLTKNRCELGFAYYSPGSITEEGTSPQETHDSVVIHHGSYRIGSCLRKRR
jgi:hypothetical protein